jgi:hypothetical protein
MYMQCMHVYLGFTLKRSLLVRTRRRSRKSGLTRTHAHTAVGGARQEYAQADLRVNSAALLVGQFKRGRPPTFVTPVFAIPKKTDAEVFKLIGDYRQAGSGRGLK